MSTETQRRLRRAIARHLRVGVFLGAMLCALPFASSSELEKSSTDVVERIREIYAQANLHIEKNRVEPVILRSEAGRDGYEIKRWHLQSETREYEVGAYEVRAFIVDGQVLKTSVELQSLSGDWAYVVEYYYYQNGKVAFIFEGNTTYNGYVVRSGKKVAPEGPFVVEKRSYFSGDGVRVRHLEKAYLKRTREVVPITQIQNIEPVKFGAVCSLPFISLIRERIRVCH